MDNPFKDEGHPAHRAAAMREQTSMRKLKFVVLSLILFVPLAASPVFAQVTIDMAKVTCQQYLLDQIAESRLISAWLSGYYNAKRNTTIVDPQSLASNADKVADFCRANKTMPLMKAVETTLGLGK
jgi:acid stress chaperone HdeB